MSFKDEKELRKYGGKLISGEITKKEFDKKRKRTKKSKKVKRITFGRKVKGEE